MLKSGLQINLFLDCFKNKKKLNMLVCFWLNLFHCNLTKFVTLIILVILKIWKSKIYLNIVMLKKLF